MEKEKKEAPPAPIAAPQEEAAPRRGAVDAGPATLFPLAGVESKFFKSFGENVGEIARGLREKPAYLLIFGLVFLTLIGFPIGVLLVGGTAKTELLVLAGAVPVIALVIVLIAA